MTRIVCGGLFTMTLIAFLNTLGAAEAPLEPGAASKPELVLSNLPIGDPSIQNLSQTIPLHPLPLPQPQDSAPMPGDTGRSEEHRTAIEVRPPALMLDPSAELPSEQASDVPITMNSHVERSLRLFKQTLRPKFDLWLDRSGRYETLMREILRSEGLPEDLIYVALIESGFNPKAYSRAKAVGPWQFVASTARRYGLMINAWVDERRDPIKSTRAAAAYLKDLYALFGSWPLALASYNAGEGKVGRAIQKTKTEDFWEIQKTRFLKRETRNYVPHFMAAKIIAGDPEEHGFFPDYYAPLDFDEIVIERPTDLRLVARLTGTTYETIKDLNPELRWWCTPPYLPLYTLRIPPGTAEAFWEQYSQAPEEALGPWKEHVVKKGDTIPKLAKQYKLTAKILMDVNALDRKSRIQEGNRLIVPPPHAMAEFGKESHENDKRKGKGSVRTAVKEDPKGASTPLLYRVRKGDSLWTIARKHGTTTVRLQAWNPAARGKTIKPGETLKIYAKLSSPSEPDSGAGRRPPLPTESGRSR
ncbi:MAG: transglycosylase SLT domain-containing protein [Nitrospirae bacterium]|nr:transglycosylase SLT domain-containing protein [Nitrospirota bacterium]